MMFVLQELSFSSLTPEPMHASTPVSVVERQPLRRHRLRSDSLGAVTTEYIVIVGTVALGLAAALAALGPGLITDYEKTRTIVSQPEP